MPSLFTLPPERQRDLAKLRNLAAGLIAAIGGLELQT
jgi:hypothetical protein